MNWNRLLVGLLLTFFGCRQQTSFERPSYSDLPQTDSLRLAIRRVWNEVPKPGLPEGKALSGPWQFVKGTAETLTNFGDPRWIEAQEVSLPHRVELPNTVLWYTYIVGEDIQASVLSLRADDGAQVFLSGQKLSRLTGDDFSIAAFAGDTVAIRVLNNAMAGGLSSATLLGKSAFDGWQRQMRTYLQIDMLVDQALRINSPPIGFLEKVVACVQSRSTEALEEASKVVRSRPYLAGPVLMMDTAGLVYQWLSNEPGLATVWSGQKGPTLSFREEINSEGLIFRLRGNEFQEKEVFGLRQNEAETAIYYQSDSGTARFSFNIWADSQGGWEIFGRLMRNTRSHHDSFSIGAGDLVANGSDSAQWKDLFGALSQAGGRFPFYLVPGNHDYDGYYDDLTPQYFTKYTTTPSGKNYFSWKYGNCAFIAIDPNNSFPIGFRQAGQYEWFLKEIQSEQWKQATWHFVVLHQPPFSQGWPGYHGDQVVRDLLAPYYHAADIDFVVAGHTHDYERLTKTIDDQKVTFLIVGGGGGGLESENELSDYPLMDTVIRRHHLVRMYVAGDSIHMEVRGIDDDIIETKDFTKR